MPRPDLLVDFSRVCLCEQTNEDIGSLLQNIASSQRSSSQGANNPQSCQETKVNNDSNAIYKVDSLLRVTDVKRKRAVLRIKNSLINSKYRIPIAIYMQNDQLSDPVFYEREKEMSYNHTEGSKPPTQF
jgi:hypothetical protein